MRSRGEGSVYRRADGKWVAQVVVGRLPNGRLKYLRRIRPTKQAAARALTDLRREAGIPAAAEGVTVAQWCATWLADCADRVKAGTMAPKTAVGYESDVRLHIVPRLGRIRLDKLAPGHVQRMMTAMQAAGHKPRTAGAARGTLSAALTAAVADGLITLNVARAAKPPARPAPNPSSFSPEEFDVILDRCRQHRLGPMFVLSLLTGMRTSELIGLRWADVDLEEGTYQVTEGLHRIGRKGAEALGIDSGLVSSKPKTTGSGEPTPLSPAAIETLRRQRKLQAVEQLAAASWSETGRVFTTPIGTPLDASNVRREWRQLLVDADVKVKSRDGKGRGLHELRRTFATRLRDQGVRLEDVQRLGRWSSPTTLLRHYAAVDEQRLRNAAAQSDLGVNW